MVVDTSIFIEFLRAADKTKTSLYKIPDDYQIFISAIHWHISNSFLPLKGTCAKPQIFWQPGILKS